MSAVTDILTEKAALCGISLTDTQTAQFARYTEVLLDWGTRMNLTAIKDDEGIAVKHFLDSILLTQKLALPEGARLIDVGSGAGFPGVPVKIMRPDIHITLADSTNKRVGFLTALLKELSLEGETVHARAEDLGRSPAYRERYDIATARAVAHLRELSEYCLPFVNVGGVFAAMKSKAVDEEIGQAKRAIGILGGQVQAIERFSLSEGGERAIVVIKKISQTPTLYPRPGAKMAKYPLQST
ncbi:MAG: 16S rRNA (guanine(527)-N(7))-methyltransferase RsmG [Acetanaerobacterium sp.]